MILLIDNFDSFVYNLADYVKQNKVEMRVIRNNKLTISEIERLAPIGIILSPGPKTPDDAGICLEVVEKLKHKIPILGVCLGHQVIGQSLGGKVCRALVPVHGKTSTIAHNGQGIFKGIENPTTVIRYHSLIVKNEPILNLDVTSTTKQGEIMSFQHKRFPLYGVQFHPEALLSVCGMQMIENFIDICKTESLKK
jgi:anthranilate synthase/aminodeoxychorismate synthase-like glutamine amidotransferase